MITFSIRLVRKLDKELGDITKQDLNQLLGRYGLLQSIEKVERETSPTKVRESIIRLIKTEAPGLAASFREHYWS